MGKTQKEQLEEITARLEQGILELFNSERFREYLQVMSQFHRYSLRNTILIAMQKPDATRVAGFNTWKTKFGRTVKKGEKGIRILAPAPKKIKQEQEKFDPKTKLPIIGEDGEPVREEKEIVIPRYKIVSVFDVSQTEGKELPDIAVDELTGSVERYEDFFAALKAVSPFPITFAAIPGRSHGYCDCMSQCIVVDEGMSELQTLKTTIHEIAHAKLHDTSIDAKTEKQTQLDRQTKEVQAKSVAYTVCQHYGLDTSEYSFGYVVGWSSGKTLPELKSSVEVIHRAAAEIISGIDRWFAELRQEQETGEQLEIAA